MPAPRTELHYASSFQLLVAVILSAQCTDRRVNMVTPELFRHFPDAESLSNASFEEVFRLIGSISYPNNKARHLIGMAKKLCRDFGSEVPSDIDSLMSLPGVGRKTANPEGVVGITVHRYGSVLIDIESVAKWTVVGFADRYGFRCEEVRNIAGPFP